MLPPRNLSKLHPKHRIRKAALLYREVELALHSPDAAVKRQAADYALSLAAFLAADVEAPEDIRNTAADLPSRFAPSVLGGSQDEGALRAVNDLRHRLLSASGQSSADWDLLDPATGRLDPASRLVHGGMRAYLEDVRSPFNIGSMLRTADAFGLEELLLSPEAADPEHPRASRSAMGAGAVVAWRRASLLEAAEADGGGLFALELGGTPLDSFVFPEKGMVIVGSEELGVSREALDLAEKGLGLISIPMSGSKGSLNVGVAFGILLHAWSRSRG